MSITLGYGPSVVLQLKVTGHSSGNVALLARKPMKRSPKLTNSRPGVNENPVLALYKTRFWDSRSVEQFLKPGPFRSALALFPIFSGTVFSQASWPIGCHQASSGAPDLGYHPCRAGMPFGQLQSPPTPGQKASAEAVVVAFLGPDTAAVPWLIHEGCCPSYPCHESHFNSSFHMPVYESR